MDSNSPKDCCFSSSMIHTNHEHVKSNWEFLNRGYDEEESMKEAICLIRPHTMVTYDGLVNCYHIVKYLEEAGIAGAIIETGVWEGGSAAMMAIASKRFRKRNFSYRQFHLFDSFLGLPQPIFEHDYFECMEQDWGIKAEDCQGDLKYTGALTAAKSAAEKAMYLLAEYPQTLVTFHVGWFQDTIPVAVDSIGEIALLRLDGDLYESTLVALRQLYPLVKKGGFIIIDDWGALKGCRKACEEYFNEIGINPFIHYVDATVRYIVKD